MNRVIIIGSQGSGKSTIARQVALGCFTAGLESGEILLTEEEGVHGYRPEQPVYESFAEQGGGIISAPVRIFTVNGDAHNPDASDDGFYETTDAIKWADAFLRTISEKPHIPYDAGAMLGWFANAIMRGHDAAIAKNVDPLLRYVRAMEKLVQCDGITEEFTSFNSGDMYDAERDEPSMEVEEVAAFREFEQARKALLYTGVITPDDNTLFPNDVPKDGNVMPEIADAIHPSDD